MHYNLSIKIESWDMRIFMQIYDAKHLLLGKFVLNNAI